jgi:hypothetical protein
MSDEFCKEAQPVRQEIYRVSRDRLAAILAASPGERARLAKEAKAELLALRATALSRLPAGGCHGARCLTPLFDHLQARIEATALPPEQSAIRQTRRGRG